MALPKIRPATPEEIESIREHSDITPTSSVVALDPPQGVGGKPIIAVLRNCLEIDPVHFNDANNRQKTMFMGLLENALAFSGVKEYYMNVHADEQHYRDALKGWGAVEVSTVPEVRIKKLL